MKKNEYWMAKYGSKYPVPEKRGLLFGAMYETKIEASRAWRSEINRFDIEIVPVRIEEVKK